MNLEEKLTDIETLLGRILVRVNEIDSGRRSMKRRTADTRNGQLPRIEAIQVMVANKLNGGYLIPYRGNQPHVVYLRSIAMLLARECGYSFPVIGRAFDKHHTSVMHAVKVVRRSAGAKLNSLLDELRLELKIKKAE